MTTFGQFLYHFTPKFHHFIRKHTELLLFNIYLRQETNMFGPESPHMSISVEKKLEINTPVIISFLWKDQNVTVTVTIAFIGILDRFFFNETRS